MLGKSIKSIIGKFGTQNHSFRKSLTIANEEITDKKSIPEKFKFLCEHRYKSGG